MGKDARASLMRRKGGEIFWNYFYAPLLGKTLLRGGVGKV
jgi:hypothetical protein